MVSSQNSWLGRLRTRSRFISETGLLGSIYIYRIERLCIEQKYSLTFQENLHRFLLPKIVISFHILFHFVFNFVCKRTMFLNLTLHLSIRSNVFVMELRKSRTGSPPTRLALRGK